MHVANVVGSNWGTRPEEAGRIQVKRYPPTIPVAPTITTRFWPAIGTLIRNPEELQQR
jgi:hypothetical protein